MGSSVFLIGRQESYFIPQVVWRMWYIRNLERDGFKGAWMGKMDFFYRTDGL